MLLYSYTGSTIELYQHAWRFRSSFFEVCFLVTESSCVETATSWLQIAVGTVTALLYCEVCSLPDSFSAPYEHWADPYVPHPYWLVVGPEVYSFVFRSKQLFCEHGFGGAT